MSKVNRGGLSLTTGKIGRLNCIRQQIMMPGERMDMSLKGKIRLETLRERDVMRINAKLATFLTPLRWLVPTWPQYVTEGPNTAVTIPSESWTDWSIMGLGAKAELTPDTMYSHFIDNYLRVANEWYKWPEADDFVRDDVQGSPEKNRGVPCVPLEKTWSRMRFNSEPENATDYTEASATTFDIRDLAETQAKFRGAMKRDVLSFKRWNELVKETWSGDGSREVDKVPMLIESAEVGVNPREMPATDGASLGQWQSMFDFDVDHQVNEIIAPEHCIVSTFLVIRFSATVEGKHPLAAAGRNDWYTLVGDPEMLASQRPQPVEAADLFLNGTETVLGYLPAGWQWRADHDVISGSIDVRDSFPYSLVPTTQAETKDATRVKSAFRSQALDDYVADIYVRETCTQPIGDSMDSYFSGMTDQVQTGVGDRNKEFPKGGKQL